MFNFNDYVKGAEPWIVTSWSVFIGMWFCLFYGIASHTNPITEFIGFELPRSEPVLIIGILLALFTMCLNLGLKFFGHYLEINIVNGTREYGSRFSAGFIVVLSFDGLNGSYGSYGVDSSTILQVYVFSLIVQLFVFIFICFIMKKYYKGNWEKRRLDGKKLSFQTYTMAMRSVRKSILTQSFLEKMDALDIQVQNSSSYEEVCKLHKHILQVRDGLKAQTTLLKT